MLAVSECTGQDFDDLKIVRVNSPYECLYRYEVDTLDGYVVIGYLCGKWWKVLLNGE